jgi:hypothetical protein
LLLHVTLLTLTVIRSIHLLTQAIIQRQMIFDPLSLRPDASLNRTRLAALPDAQSAWVGQPAFSLLSRDVLVALVTRMGEPDAARVFGRRLGHLIASLHLSEDADADQSDWRRAYRAHWRTISQVWLGGGLAAWLGQTFVADARAEANRLGAGRVAIELARYPESLPLIGAARSTLHDHAHTAVLDLGHTSIKPAVAAYENGMLARLDLLGLRPAPPSGEVERRVAEAIAETLDRASADVDPTVVVSLASYVSPSGQVEDTHSLYAPLRWIPAGELLERVRQQSGKRVERVRFSHDGTLAGAGVGSGASHGAVIMLGTSLGAGFVPSAGHLRPLARSFRVSAAGSGSMSRTGDS